MQQNPSAATACDSAFAPESAVLKLERLALETVATWISGLTLERIDFFCQHDEFCTMVEHINSLLVSVCKQGSGQLAPQVELRDAPESSAWFKAC